MFCFCKCCKRFNNSKINDSKQIKPKNTIEERITKMEHVVTHEFNLEKILRIGINYRKI